MLELSALGLLQQQPLHGYRLKQELELFMSSCISVNYGAIYPLLKRLQEQGMITTLAEESSKEGPCRKIYSITPAGRDRWHQKMLEHPTESWTNSRSRFAIKFFFFSELSQPERVKLLEHRIAACRLRHAEWESEPLPADPYQAEIWRRHLFLLQSEIDWLLEHLAKEKQPTPPFSLNRI